MGMKEGDSIEAPMLTRAVEKAQRKVEERNFTSRKNILEYDEPMEFQRRSFYGMRQPVLEGRGVRDLVWRFLGDAVREAANLYLGPEHAGRCLAEWSREHFGNTMEPRRFRGREPAEVKELIVRDAKEEAQGRIELAVAEFMPAEGQPEDFDVAGLAKWAKETYRCELDGELVRARDRVGVRKAVESAAAAMFEAVDMTPVDGFLVPDFSLRELAVWTDRMLGVKIDPASMQGVEGPEEAAERLLDMARKAYEEREVAYPIDFAMEFTAAQMPVDAKAALGQFCAWARSRYELDWTPETLPSNDPRELRRLLDETARTLTDERIRDRASRALAAGRTPEAIGAWFEAQGLARLGERELEEAGTDPERFTQERLKDCLRAELRQFERWVLIQVLDNAWKDHLRAMDQIRDAIGFRAFSQKDPRIEFKKEAARLYDEMLVEIRNRVAEVALKGRLVPQVQQPARPATPPPPAEGQSDAPATESMPAPRVDPAVVGRNEPCPCGSGKKFKHCHGVREKEAKA
jgi:preprotein translocase subunit SecA